MPDRKRRGRRERSALFAARWDLLDGGHRAFIALGFVPLAILAPFYLWAPDLLSLLLLVGPWLGPAFTRAGEVRIAKELTLGNEVNLQHIVSGLRNVPRQLVVMCSPLLGGGWYGALTLWSVLKSETTIVTVGFGALSLLSAVAMFRFSLADSLLELRELSVRRALWESWKATGRHWRAVAGISGNHIAASVGGFWLFGQHPLLHLGFWMVVGPILRVAWVRTAMQTLEDCDRRLYGPVGDRSRGEVSESG